jgi:alpha-D-ribose 1-methylphosphonate 5-phosphate C-P lyase
MPNPETDNGQQTTDELGFNFAYLDEQTKRSIRRSLLKAVAIPGHQIPFGSREMPMSYGWGTGGIQVTASIIGKNDVLKSLIRVQMTRPMPLTFAVSLVEFAALRQQKALWQQLLFKPAIAFRNASTRRANYGLSGADS